MTVQEFIQSHAGRGTVGIFLFAAILTIPPALTWLAATIALLWGLDHLRAAFRAVEAEERRASVARAAPARQGIASECYELATID